MYLASGVGRTDEMANNITSSEDPSVCQQKGSRQLPDPARANIDTNEPTVKMMVAVLSYATVGHS
jgi:hypothetical protein